VSGGAHPTLVGPPPTGRRLAPAHFYTPPGAEEPLNAKGVGRPRQRLDSRGPPTQRTPVFFESHRKAPRGHGDHGSPPPQVCRSGGLRGPLGLPTTPSWRWLIPHTEIEVGPQRPRPRLERRAAATRGAGPLCEPRSGNPRGRRGSGHGTIRSVTEPRLDWSPPACMREPTRLRWRKKPRPGHLRAVRFQQARGVAGGSAGGAAVVEVVKVEQVRGNKATRPIFRGLSPRRGKDGTGSAATPLDHQRREVEPHRFRPTFRLLRPLLDGPRSEGKQRRPAKDHQEARGRGGYHR